MISWVNILHIFDCSYKIQSPLVAVRKRHNGKLQCPAKETSLLYIDYIIYSQNGTATNQINPISSPFVKKLLNHIKTFQHQHLTNPLQSFSVVTAEWCVLVYNRPVFWSVEVSVFSTLALVEMAMNPCQEEGDWWVSSQNSILLRGQNMNMNVCPSAQTDLLHLQNSVNQHCCFHSG